ncbi:MAG TPA: ribonuclease PH [Candidatus Omnitrophota bacterium]|jgi:ribonuclease PH|nr:MAG: Ribonuclease PH [Candidatus Omnitrophica bacterium ADurb.Bin314]HOE69042.1 ribonuclease PH [Candidatus Omnitrophota bacterium]HQB93862.1 ribonuclease PH [Candidatus Omnitrophota bacterium]
MRIDGRRPGQLRKLAIRTDYLKFADGSCLIEMGETRVVCSASIEEKVPPFCKSEGKGWVTAEYGMLPASCSQRIQRESSKGRPSGRTQEIQRLIGRSLRSVVDLKKIGERTIWLDADVIQGDGGTRTASITGCYIALCLAVKKLLKSGVLTEDPVRDSVAAISVGVVKDTPMLDLCYEEDSKAEVDMNVVMTGSGKIVEVQGTAEGKPFSEATLLKLLTLAKKGVRELTRAQKKAL